MAKQTLPQPLGLVSPRERGAGRINLWPRPSIRRFIIHSHHVRPAEAAVILRVLGLAQRRQALQLSGMGLFGTSLRLPAILPADVRPVLTLTQ